MSNVKLQVSPDALDACNRILSGSRVAGPDDVLYAFTARFDDGWEADIKVCNGDPPFIDPVLFNNSGYEVRCLQDDGVHVEGEYHFDDSHVVVIERGVCNHE